MQRLKVKFKSLPFSVENRLVTKHGFSVYSRDNVEDWVILVKNVDKRNKLATTPEELTEGDQNELIKICNRVVDVYEKPQLHVNGIMVRLRNIGCTRSPAEREFIKQWADKWVVNASVFEDDQEVLIIQ